MLKSRPVGFDSERVPLTGGTACLGILEIGFELPGEASMRGLVTVELNVPTEEVKRGF